MATSIARARRRAKIMALLSGGLVLGVGATATLASWSDTEWVSASIDGETPAVGTSSFEVLQNTTRPYVDTAGNWRHAEDNPGSALLFSPGALALSPGSSVYAPVALRTDAGSTAGTVQLAAAVAAADITVADAGGHLWSALVVRVSTRSSAFACDSSAFASGVIIAGSSAGLGAAAASSTQALDADGGSTQFYCFEITLPDTSAVRDHDPSLQGRTVAPAWRFDAESAVS